MQLHAVTEQTPSQHTCGPARLATATRLCYHCDDALCKSESIPARGEHPKSQACVGAMRLVADLPKQGLAASIFSCDSSRHRRASAVARSGSAGAGRAHPPSGLIRTLPRADPCSEALDLARTAANQRDLSAGDHPRPPQQHCRMQVAPHARQPRGSPSVAGDRCGSG